MQERKTIKANLEPKRLLFFGIGLIISLALTLSAFKTRVYQSDTFDFQLSLDDQDTLLPIPIIKTPEPIKPQQPQKAEAKPTKSDEITVVDHKLPNKPQEFTTSDSHQKGDSLLLVSSNDLVPSKTENSNIPTFAKFMPYYKSCKRIKDPMERYKCSEKKMRRKVQSNFALPNLSGDAAKGTVIVSFVINREGRVTNVQVIHSTNPALNLAAIKAVEKIGVFKPAQNANHETIPVMINIPIRVE